MKIVHIIYAGMGGHGDVVFPKIERDIENEIAGLKKLNKDSSAEVTTRLKYAITSVNELTESKDIREFVDKYLLASDARALRKHIVRSDFNE